MAVQETVGSVRSLPTGTVTEQAFSPDGKTLYTVRNGTVTAYDVASGEAAGSWTLGTKLGGIDVSPDGTSLIALERTPGPVTGNWPNYTVHHSLYQLDLATGQTKTHDIIEVDSYPEGFADVAFLKDGTVLVGGAGQWQPLTLLDLATGTMTTTRETFQGVTLTTSADRGTVLVGPLNISDAPLHLYRVGEGVTASHELYADGISGFNSGVQAISPDGSLSVQQISLAVYDSDLTLVTKLTSRYEFTAAGLGFSPDGSKLYLLDGASNDVFVLSTTSWDVLGGYAIDAKIGTTDSYYYYEGSSPATRYGNAMLVSADGSHLSIAAAVSVQVIDLATAVSSTGTSTGDDVVRGDSNANTLYGFEGDDTLDGGAGADRMYGGSGDDTYYVRDQGDQVIERARQGNDTVYSSISYATADEVETVILTGTAATDAYGNQGANTLIGSDAVNGLWGGDGDDVLVGNGGADKLDGGLGNDRMSGGAGDDVYHIDSPADVIVEEAGQGTDIVYSKVSFVLSANVDRLVLIAEGNLSGTGNALDNELTGTAGDNALNGAAGDDLLVGGGGYDRLTGGAGADTFRGTLKDMAGDTIVDLSAGDRIVFTGTNTTNFRFTLRDGTLDYGNGRSIALSDFTGHLRMEAQAGGGVALVAVGQVDNDFNGDGRSDILWRNAGAMSTWLAAGTSFDGTGGTTALMGAEWKIAGVADFNEDGRSDVLWRHDDGRIMTWLATRAGFESAGGNAYQVATGWKVAGVGDFTGDGRADILWRADNGRVTGWVSSGNGFSAAAGVDYTTGSEWKVAGTGDLNGDGRDDILWRNDNGRITAWLGSAAGFDGASGVDYQVTADWKVAGVADFNGDGRDDILWRNDSGLLTEWVAGSNGFAQGAFSAVVPTGWGVADTGDYNGDGRADILWRNADGALAEWVSTGAGFAQNPGVGFTVGDDWAIWG